MPHRKQTLPRMRAPRRINSTGRYMWEIKFDEEMKDSVSLWKFVFRNELNKVEWGYISRLFMLKFHPSLLNMTKEAMLRVQKETKDQLTTQRLQPQFDSQRKWTHVLSTVSVSKAEFKQLLDAQRESVDLLKKWAQCADGKRKNKLVHETFCTCIGRVCGCSESHEDTQCRNQCCNESKDDAEALSRYLNDESNRLQEAYNLGEDYFADALNRRIALRDWKGLFRESVCLFSRYICDENQTKSSKYYSAWASPMQWGAELRIMETAASKQTSQQIRKRPVSSELDLVTSMGPSKRFRFDNETALMVAVGAGEAGRNLVSALLWQKCDVNEKDGRGLTALHKAAATGDEEVTKLLLSHGANPTQADNSGKTPIFTAARRGHKQVLSAMIEAIEGQHLSIRDAVNRADCCGNTALMSAARHGHLEILVLLLDLGANPSMATVNGTQAIHYAAKDGRIDCLVELMQRLGSECLSYQDKDRVTPLDFLYKLPKEQLRTLSQRLSDEEDHVGGKLPPEVGRYMQELSWEHEKSDLGI